jgi:SRSO17 transposase
MSMDRRFEVRKAEMLSDCEVRPEVFRGMMMRLDTFAEPFVACLRRPEQRCHTHTYLRGLLSDVERKNAEAIAYRHDEERQGLQTFLGTAPWNHQPLLSELARQVGQTLGEPDGVLALDPSAFPKKGRHSVGVVRQWCGRLGKVENCQVGVFLGYVSRHEQVVVNMRLYLPKEWAADRKRRKECGVPRSALPNATPIGIGDARRTGFLAAARLGHRRRRNGPSGLVSPGIAAARRALLAGGARQCFDP